MLFAQSCSEKNDEPSGAPSIELSASSVTFEKDGGDQVIQVTATRDWKVEIDKDADWVAVDPQKGNASGKAEDVTISVNQNTGLDRTATVKFTIGFETKALVVNQKGTGSSSDAIVYSNDFDKEEATKTFGTSKSSWPYLDQFEGWKNATGTGLGSEKYSYSGMSVRANSTSNGNYSDYSGSGSNNLFFGANAYFSVQGLKLSSDLNYTLTFGAEKYSQDNGSLFKHDEFHVYISNDAKKWVELEYVFPNGDKEGKWDCATSNFTIPSGTSALSIYVKTDVASSYRLDDLKLSIASAAGSAIDFSKGIDLGTGSGETPEPGTDYSKAESKTVADFIAAANKTTYYKLKGTVSGFNSQYCSFDLTDATGKIYVYSVANKAEWSSKVKNGGTIELAGLYDYYETKSQHEVVNAQILSFTEGEASVPSEIKDATVAEFLAAETSGTVLYRLTGEITEIKNTTYGNLMLKDATGEVLIYGVKKDKDASSTSFSELGAEVGDKLTVVGNRDEYNGEKEMKNGYCEKLEKDTTTPKFSVSKENLSVASTATSASFDVKGNVKWTVASDNAAYTVSPVSGEGNGTVTVKFAANETDKDVTVKLTVSTTADIATKSYTIVLTHKAKGAAAEEDYSSNVTWTLGANAYDETSSGNSMQSAKVNDVEVNHLLKLGTSSKAGVATLKIPAGTSKVSFYGVAWNGKGDVTLTASVGGTQVASQVIAPNSGAVGNPPYTLTVTESEHYVITFPSKVASDTDVTITTAAAGRVVLFAIRAE